MKPALHQPSEERVKKQNEVTIAKLTKLLKSEWAGPGQCGSVGWVSFHKLKGHRFDSQSGHTPGFSPRSGCLQKATNQYFSLFLPLYN